MEGVLPAQRRLPEFRRRAPISLAEGSTEMTMAGEAKLQTQSSKVVILRKQIQRPSQSQPQLIAIQRYAFHLLKNLRKVNRRAAHLSADLRQSPTPRQIIHQHQLHPVH